MAWLVAKARLVEWVANVGVPEAVPGTRAATTALRVDPAGSRICVTGNVKIPIGGHSVLSQALFGSTGCPPTRILRGRVPSGHEPRDSNVDELCVAIVRLNRMR